MSMINVGIVSDCDLEHIQKKHIEQSRQRT